MFTPVLSPVLFLVATLGCLYGRNEMHPTTLQYAPGFSYIGDANRSTAMILGKPFEFS